jgi:hypothetical protein
MNNVQLDGDLSLSYNQLMSLDVVTVDTLPEKKVCYFTSLSIRLDNSLSAVLPSSARLPNLVLSNPKHDSLDCLYRLVGTIMCNSVRVISMGGGRGYFLDLKEI